MCLGCEDWGLWPDGKYFSQDDTIRKLNQTFQAPSAFESSDYDDDSALGGDVLEQLQVSRD